MPILRPSSLLLLLVALGCGGRREPAGPPPLRVHVVGYQAGETDPDGSTPYQALHWVDGKPTPLSPGLPSNATAIALDGRDVVVGGLAQIAGGMDRGMVWRNGVATILPGGPGGASKGLSIAAGGGQVLVGGIESLSEPYGAWRPALWSQGQALPLGQTGDPGGDGSLGVFGVALTPAGPVAAGQQPFHVEYAPHHILYSQQAVQWQGGLLRELTGGTTNAGVYALAVQGGEMLAVGYLREVDVPAGAPAAVEAFSGAASRRSGPALERLRGLRRAAVDTSLRAMLWRDGRPQVLDSGGKAAKALGVCTEGPDVYVAGWVERDGGLEAVYWRNGVMTRLMPAKAPALGWAWGIAVDAGRVYVCGAAVVDGQWRAVVWAGDRVVSLSDGRRDAEARGIALERLE